MLELEHLQKSFDGVPVLKDISLQVEDGEIVSILGPSGCGKTTLLNMILGIVDADQGVIRYNGEDLTRTLVMKPRILLLDEPLSALDGVIKESIKDRIKTIAREYHLTTIIVTHDPEEALTLSDRVLIIDQGTISQYAKPDEIIHQPKNDFVRKFILRQLEIKRGNIYALFGDRPQLAGEAV